jgi:glycosyltransferase 2 family protein
VLRDIGGHGFVLYAVWQVLLFVLMGVAWWAVVPRGEGRLPVFVWGRMVRDAAACCLPFSQVGGFVLGALAVTLHGVSAPVATITTVVDATAEFVAEILFLTVGLMIVLVHEQGMGATTPIALGLGAALIAGVIAMRVQHRAAYLFVWFGRRVLGQWVAARSDGETVPRAELTRIYSHAGRVATGRSLHLIASHGVARAPATGSPSGCWARR